MIFKVFPFISPTTFKSSPTNELEVTVEVPTTSNVLDGFVFPIPSFPSFVRDASIIFDE